jgi:predicted nucleic acid-binding protein
LIIDVLDDDPEFGPASARLIDRMSGEGLAICPVSYVELAPAFLGDRRRQDEFLANIRIDPHSPWERKDTELAHKTWDLQIRLRRQSQAPRRPVADILIGAYAMGRTGLLTRNPADFKAVFPNLKIHIPE